METVTFQQLEHTRGMNAAALPAVFESPSHLSLLVNGTVRTGFAKTRPGWEWRPLNFTSSSAQLVFETGKYQGSEPFLSSHGPAMVYVVDGHVFLLDIGKWLVEKLTEKPAFSKYSSNVWIKQRAKWFIVQDGVSPPFVSTGTDHFQEVRSGGVPLGTIMVEGWHRLAVVSPNRRRIYFSDHEMDPNSTPISFTESTQYYASARYFEAPQSLGRIVGMAFTPFQDTSTGIGPLLVFCERGMRAYDISIPRTQWATSDISQTILPRIGASSFFSFTDKGSELMFRDHAGRIRTVRNAQQVEATDSGFTADFNIHPVLGDEIAGLRRTAQAVTFDNRCLFLTHPESTVLGDGRRGIVFKGIAAHENEAMTDAPFTWAFWTGMGIAGIDVCPVDNDEMCLAICADPDGRNRVYELTKTGLFDTMPSSNGATSKPVLMTIATPRFNFGGAIQTKRYSAGGMRITGMSGVVKVRGLWERDSNPPVEWFSHVECHDACIGFDEGCGVVFKAKGSNSRLVFPTVPDKEATFNKARAIFEISGSAQVEELAIVASVSPPSPVSNTHCTADPPCKSALACDVDLFQYNAFLAAPA